MSAKGSSFEHHAGDDTTLSSDVYGNTALDDSQFGGLDAALLGNISIDGFAPASVGATALTQTLYLTERGDSTAIAATDIHQGAMGDCYLLSAFGEIALFHPTAIGSMIHTTGTAGTETVTLCTASNGALPGFGTTSYKATTVTVKNSSFATYGVNGLYSYSQDIVGTQQEIWAQTIENAYATLNGGYSRIGNGGYPVVAMEELTGLQAQAIPVAALSTAALVADVAAGDLLVFDTRNASSLPYGLFGNHAYMFKSLDLRAGTVSLLNPWGFDNPSPIPIARLASAGIIEVDVGHVRT